MVWWSSVGSLVCWAAHCAIYAGFAFVWFAMLRLMAMQVDVVEDATNSIAGLHRLVSLFTTRVALSALDGFLCSAGLFDFHWSSP
jgi:hypothetical protein